MFDAILASGESADDHLQNFKRLLQHLNGVALSVANCRKTNLKLLCHALSVNGIEKSSNVNNVLKMSPPHDVSSLPFSSA